jgi:hypothetical protein
MIDDSNCWVTIMFVADNTQWGGNNNKPKMLKYIPAILAPKDFLQNIHSGKFNPYKRESVDNKLGVSDLQTRWQMCVISGI